MAKTPVGPTARRKAGPRAATSLLVTLLFGCSHNPARPAAGWTMHDTRNVRVYSSTLIEHRGVQEWLETAAHTFRSSFFAQSPARPLEVMFLQVPPGALTRFSFPSDNPPASWALESMPGGGRIGRDGLIVLTDRRDTRGAARQVAYQMIHQALPNAPLWLRVGFSQYLSEYRVHYEGERWIACYGRKHGLVPPSHFIDTGGLGSSRRTVRRVAWRDILIPISDVLNADWYDYADGPQHWFNFTAYALVSYLIHGQDLWHASRFPLLLKAFAEGKSTPQALALAYPHVLFDEIDEAVAHHARTPGRGGFWEARPEGLCFPIPSAAHAEKRPADAPVGEADVQAALDDLERMPLWRKPTNWYPTDALVSRSGVLKRKPVPAGAPEGSNDSQPNQVRGGPHAN
ncbi:MAG TPA: hypothetical protein VGG33_06930 [Polyangia bacterium]